ncbi:MAG: hypothetical protein CMP81_15875 [Fulvimarina sp.]|nr:hypothetical protein [Fulvimarina sp.]
MTSKAIFATAAILASAGFALAPVPAAASMKTAAAALVSVPGAADFAGQMLEIRVFENCRQRNRRVEIVVRP